MRFLTVLAAAALACLFAIAPVDLAVASATNDLASVDMRGGIAIAGVIGLVACALVGGLLAIPKVGVMALAVTLAALALADSAFAQSTTVTIPWGNMLSEALGFIGWVFLAVAMWAMRQLPANIVSILQTLRVEQLLSKAIDYGVNAVSGATKDKALTFDVGSEVAAKAVAYAIDKMPGALLGWIGGEAKLREMVIARLNVDPAAAIE